MSTEAFIQGVTEKILTWRDANYPSLTVVTENEPNVDEAAMPDVWLDLEFRWYGASEVAVGTRPLGRHSGTVSCQIYSRAGTGSSESSKIIDSLNEELRSTRVAGGVIKFGQRSVPTDFLGWHKTGAFFPFTLDVY